MNLADRKKVLHTVILPMVAAGMCFVRAEEGMNRLRQIGQEVMGDCSSVLRVLQVPGL
jgi:hypothetical protein